MTCEPNIHKQLELLHDCFDRSLDTIHAGSYQRLLVITSPDFSVAAVLQLSSHLNLELRGLFLSNIHNQMAFTTLTIPRL